MSRRRYVRGLARTVVDSGRCIPFLLLTYLVYYALPSLGLSLDKWTAALITLVIYNTAYMAEILRAAWLHLPRGQTEGGRAFGYTGGSCAASSSIRVGMRSWPQAIGRSCRERRCASSGRAAGGSRRSYGASTGWNGPIGGAFSCPAFGSVTAGRTTAMSSCPIASWQSCARASEWCSSTSTSGPT